MLDPSILVFVLVRVMDTWLVDQHDNFLLPQASQSLGMRPEPPELSVND